MEFKFKPEEIKLKVGLEIHQQLSTPTKLFCSCPITKSEEFPYTFERRLRPAQSETGKVDPAAVFEFLKGKSNVYAWSPESSCLVEADEEPPHPLNAEAVDTCVVIANLMGSTILNEVHVMRKIVIDGSNTSGFQRTAIVALGGVLKAGDKEVGVQTITVEEDAARILDETSGSRRFALDRLGVPLVEIALDPVTAEPRVVADIALHLGRVLRSTGRVARGLGTIRQDLNVSVMGGAVVEVKGVQKLNLLPKVVNYEAARQMGLIALAAKLLAQTKTSAPQCTHKDVSTLMAESGSNVVRRQLGAGGKVVCVAAAGFAGLLGWEPSDGIRLGKELAEVARANSLGGVIHSDEFAKQGIHEKEAAELRNALGAANDDGLILIAGAAEKVDVTVGLVEERLRHAVLGVPAETRAATEDGETRYLRPRPGAQRMYPETDIPLMSVTVDRMKHLLQVVPEPWDAKVKRYEREYSLSSEMAMKLYDSDRVSLFENLASEFHIEASVMATIILELPVRLSREGVDEARITDDVLRDAIGSIADGTLAKESVPEVVRAVAKGEARDVRSAVAKMSLHAMTREELETLIDAVVSEEDELIAAKGDAAFSPIMGEVMKRAKGRADGALVSKMLRERLSTHS